MDDGSSRSDSRRATDTGHTAGSRIRLFTTKSESCQSCVSHVARKKRNVKNNDSQHNDTQQQRFDKCFNILIKPVVTEFVFTFFHLLLGIMTAAGPNLTGQAPFSLTAAALSTGLNLYAFIVATFHISGGHLNPIISYGVFLSGGFALDLAIVYVVVQLAAGIAAAGVLKVLVNNSALPEHWALIRFNANLQNEVQVVFTEALICCALLLIAYMTIVESEGKNPFGPLLIGIFVSSSIYAAGPISGAGINPARCLGPVVVFGGWKTVWVYFVGPFLGTTVAGVLYRYFFSKRKLPPLKYTALRNIWEMIPQQPSTQVVLQKESNV